MIKKYLPRNWAIWLAAIIAVLFILPAFDVDKLRTFLGLFFVMSAVSWLVLRVYWTIRTDKTTGYQAIVRDISYAIITAANITAAAHISL